MLFSEVLKSMTLEGEECRVTVGEEWLQGRGMFGGLVAAVGNDAMRRLVPSDRPLRSLQTTFVGPAGVGTWRIVARVLRVGRAVTLARCEVFDGEQIAAVQLGVYGTDRPSAVIVKPTAVPAARPIEDIRERRFLPEQQPAFVQHFALRFAEGAKPFSGQRAPTKVFIRHRDPEPPTESHIIALVDCIPTPALSMFAGPAPLSTLVWTLELFEHDLEFPADAWWRIDTDIDAASGGYVNQTGVLNDPNGRPVALSRQLCAVFG